MEILLTVLRAVKEEGIQLADVSILSKSFETTKNWWKWEWDAEKNILNGLRGVNTLHVSGWSFRTIHCMLIPTPETDLPLLALHTLLIFDVDLVPCNLPQARLADHPASCFHRLRYVFGRRKAVGTIIAVLGIDFSSKLTDKEFGILRGYVSEGIEFYEPVPQTPEQSSTLSTEEHL